MTREKCWSDMNTLKRGDRVRYRDGMVLTILGFNTILVLLSDMT
jgi:hypothetical protein